MRRLAPIIAFALVALLAVSLRGRHAATGAEPPVHPERSAPAARQVEGPPTQAPDPLVIHNVTVRDLDGRVAFRGDVDLGPALARIERGERDSHRDDGAVFGNREHRLPAHPRGWYREYVVRTPGLSGPGPQRLVLGQDGAAFYTADHYATFTQVRGPR